MHIGQRLRGVLAIVAVCLTVIGGVAVAPVPAHADSPYEVSAEELAVICGAFDGTFTEDRSQYGCVTRIAEIVCMAATQSCAYEASAAMPASFQIACEEIAEGEFIVIRPEDYACQFGLGTLFVECMANPKDGSATCEVGWVESEVPVK